MYERLYGPLGGKRDDYLAAMIAATVAAANAEAGKAPPMSDFMPDWEAAADGDDT